MTPAVIELILAFLAGGGLGSIYFLGLWWTVRKLPSSKNPALLSLGSFMVRAAVVLTGFYFIMGGEWERLLVCLVGFIGARVALIRRLKPGTSNKEASRRAR